MVTRKAIEQNIVKLSEDLERVGLNLKKLVLFGSYAKGTAKDTSDIDLALWADGFSGVRLADKEKIAAIQSRYPLFEIHPFASSYDESDPFVQEILATGIDYSEYINPNP